MGAVSAAPTPTPPDHLVLRTSNLLDHSGGGYVGGGEGVVEVPLSPELSPPDYLLLSVLLCGILISLALLLIAWLKSQMSGKEDSGGGESQWICHPVIRPEVMTSSEPQSSASPPLHPPPLPQGGKGEQESEGWGRAGGPWRPKGLLERRGSSASLTIDLIQSHGIATVTPTTECSTEEYLLSVGNVLNRAQLRCCLRDVRALHREFCELPLNHPDRVVVPGSWAKNRYMTVIPNEGTRVRLPSVDDGPADDSLSCYINANYIRGYEGEEKAYIATQGPLAHTIRDFWAMVWYERSPVIVMITKLWEKSRSKCEPYFPTDLHSSQTYDEFTVTVSSINSKEGYILRQLLIQKGEEKRNVSHFWFDSWPDHRTPPNTHSLVTLAKEVDQARFIGGGQRRLSAAWLSSPSPIKDTVSPVLTLGTLELKQEERQSPDPSAAGKKRGRQLDDGETEHGDKFFRSPLPWDGAVFRFEGGCGEGGSGGVRMRAGSRSRSEDSTDWDSPDLTAPDSAHSVFWRFEKLSTGSCGSYETAITSPSWAARKGPSDSPATTESDRSPFRTTSSADSPAFTSSSSSATSSSNKRWGRGGGVESSGESNEGVKPAAVSGAQPVSGALLSPRWGGAPASPTPVARPAGPVVVHCSAGVGRTGCFIAVSIGLSQLLWENNVDVLGIVCRMRYDRGGMVQTAEQYEFIHRALCLFERSLPDQSGE